MENILDKIGPKWLKIIFFILIVVVVGILVPVIGVITGWRETSVLDKQTNIDQKQDDWQRQQSENELAPTMVADQKDTIIYGKYEYRKYELTNSANNVAGGKLKGIYSVVAVGCRGIEVKNFYIRDALFKNEVPFDPERQSAAILLKEPQEIREKTAILEKKIKEGLERETAGYYEFDVRIEVVFTLEYSDSNNALKEQTYVVHLEEEPYCQVVNGDQYGHCDQYYLEYGKEERGEAYEEAIRNTVNRILKECREN